jgi:hypothetical protein
MVKVFISYACEEEPHPTWVEDLAIRLRTKDGLDVTLDQWHTGPGDELTSFMETGVRESHFVLLICTPTYKAKFDQRLGGVGYEAKAIAGEIYARFEKRKIIPVHRKGAWPEAAPAIVLGTAYIDLTAEPYSETSYRMLVDTLLGRRDMAPPMGYGDVLFEGPRAHPAKPVADFTGRDEELRALEDHLRRPSEDALCVVVSGIGGVGKTSLVRQFVATRAESPFHAGSAWLDGTNLVEDLARVCRRFGWPHANDPTPRDAVAFLNHELHDRALLLVIDNLPESGDRGLVPIPGGNCRTLITSRAASVSQELDVPAAAIRLTYWPPATCRSYLRKVVPRLVNETDADLDALTSFVQGLPLAARLIARALGQNVSRTAKQHLERLQLEPLGALDAAMGAFDRGVAATYLDSYNALAPLAKAALRALSSSAQGTTVEIVASITKNDISEIEDALNILYRFSLVDYRDGEAAPWGLHDMIRLFTRAQPGIRETDAAHLAWVKGHLAAYADPLAHGRLEEGIAEAEVAFRRLVTTADLAEASEVLQCTFLHLQRRGRYALLVNLTEYLLGGLPDDADDLRCVWLGNLGATHQRPSPFSSSRLPLERR